MNTIDINELRKHFAESPIYEYYSQKGQKRAAAAALSKLRMENGLASKMAKKSNAVGAPSKAGKASVRTGVQKRNGEKTIKQLLQWQIDNNFRVCDFERTKEWCNNISIALTGKKIPKSVVDKIKKTLKQKMESMTPEERSEKYSSYSFLGKNHKDESKEKMRKKANERVGKLGDDYISKERKQKMIEENGQRVVVYIFNPNNSKNKGNVSHLFLSSHQAQKYFKSGSIQHVLKNRAIRFGADKRKDGFQGYFAEYVSHKKYENLCKLYPNTIIKN